MNNLGRNDRISDPYNPYQDLYMTNRYNRVQLEKNIKRKKCINRTLCISIVFALNGLSFYLGHLFSKQLP